MRILQIHARYRERGGEDAVVDREAELLAAAGYDVTRHIVTNPTNPLHASVSLAASPWNAHQARRLTSVINKTSPDVAHVHNTWFSLSPSIFHALDRAGIPTVLTLHNYRLICANGLLYRDGRICEDCIGGSPRQAVQHRCYRDSVPQSIAAAGTISLNRRLRTWTDNVDVFISLSNLSRSKFVEDGFPEERFVTIPNSVPDPGQRTSPPSDSSTILFVGRLSDQKGIDTLLGAWSHVPELGLKVVGDGPLRTRLETEFPGADFMGVVGPSTLVDLIKDSRALAFPSMSHEPFGNVVVEAMACGTPPAVSATAGISEYVRPLGPSWIIGEDPNAWAEGLRHMLDNDAVDAAGHASRTLYERSFRASQAEERLEVAYERARDHRSQRI